MVINDLPMRSRWAHEDVHKIFTAHVDLLDCQSDLLAGDVLGARVNPASGVINHYMEL